MIDHYAAYREDPGAAWTNVPVRSSLHACFLSQTLDCRMTLATYSGHIGGNLIEHLINMADAVVGSAQRWNISSLFMY